MTFKQITSSLLLPLLYLITFALAAGGLWLGSMGQWQVIWLATLMVLFSPYVIPVLLIPAGIFSHFMGLYAASGQPRKERRMFIMSLGYLVLLIALWCTIIFEYVTHNVGPAALMAGLLWATASSMAPMFWWASRDRANTFVTAMVEVALLAVIILCVVRWTGVRTTFWFSFSVIGGILGAATWVQATYEEKYLKTH